jgi:rhodanese-related sulfurtransferase
MLENGSVVLDTRDPMVFAAGYIPGAINVGLSGDFAVWVGTIIDADVPLLLVTDAGREKEAIERLARIGYEKVNGYLEGGMEAWFASNIPYENIMTFNGKECSPLLETEDYSLLDVRNRLEVARHRISGSVHIPLNVLKSRLDSLEKNKKWLIYCAGGYRSMIAASILKAHGYHFVASIEGGIKEVIQHAPEMVEMDVE